MKNLVPSDPNLRKMVLPSIIRISDAFTGRANRQFDKRTARQVHSLKKSKVPHPSKTTFTSHSFRAVMVQLQLDLS